MSRTVDARGFTLIEVLIAFTVAVLLLLPLLRSFTNGITSASRTDGFTEATLIAESTLEAVGPSTPLVDGGGTEQQQGAYQISTAVHRYHGDGAPEQELLIAVPYEIVVTVRWPEAARMRSIALRTVRLGPPPNQGQPPP